MKLRVRGNSLRLRLTEPEVHALVERGRVEEVVSFGPDTRLTYALVCGDSFGARLIGAAIVVTVPSTEARTWASTDRVSLDATQRELRILVEKDWACAKPRGGEDETGAYPHPTGKC